MKTIELKEELHQIIDRIKDRDVLQAVIKLLEEKNIVASTVDGEPLNQSQLERQIKDAEQDIISGKVHTHAYVEQFINNKINR